MTLESTIQWLGLGIAILTFVSLLWVKVIKPVRNFFTGLKTWMNRMETAVKLVEAHLKPNSGKTLMDKTSAAAVAAEVAAKLASNTAESLAGLDRKVTTLLKHDRERDQPGLRYGTDDEGETT